jgi:hypothetical protein
MSDDERSPRRMGRKPVRDGDSSAQVNVKLPATDFDALYAEARRQRCTAPELGRQAIARRLRRDDDEE